MLTITPQPPPQKVAPVSEDGTFSRPWYLFLIAVSKALADFIAGAVYGRPALLHANRVTKVTESGTIGEASFADTDVVTGATALTHVNRVPKVTAAGVLGESSITDDGTKILTTEPADVTGAIRALSTAAAAAAAGKGVEIRYDSGGDAGEILAYDRTGAAYKNLALNAALLLLEISGTEIVRVTAAGADLTGAGAVLKVAGTQVVGPRGAAVTSPTGGGTTVVAPSGGGTIDVQARAAIGSLITVVSSAGNTVDLAGRSSIDEIRARLAAHGLIA